MSLISIKKEQPMCWQSGDWDGKRSDLILCVDEREEYHLARYYKGFMDGSNFCDWYDKDGFSIQPEVLYWMYLPKRIK